MDSKLIFTLHDIKNKEIVLPEFQREYTWDKQQAKELLDSMLSDYPIGSFLVWKTINPPALKNMEHEAIEGPVKVLLDGQQRLTALYLLIKNDIPPYYKHIDRGNDPRNLYYNLENGQLEYYMPKKMGNNPAWVAVIDCFQDNINLEMIANNLSADKEDDGGRFKLFTDLSKNLEAIKKIKDYELSIMRVGENSNLKDALIVFDRVNTGGTPLSEADIALAYMCSNWNETRRSFKKKIKELTEKGFDLDLRFMVRAMNAVINGRAYYSLLHNIEEEKLREGWRRLELILNYVLNILKHRAYVYSTDDLNSPNVLIPIIGYLAKSEGKFKSEEELKKMLYWMYAALYRRRYSSSVDQYLEKDLGALKEKKPINALINFLEEEEGSLEVAKGELQERGIAHPFYNMMSFVIRANKGIDWVNHLDLSSPIGKEFQVQQHHIFPKSVLEEAGYNTGKNKEHYNKVHEIANRVPLTKSTNLFITNKKPSEYLDEIEKNNPGNLKKFLIPDNSEMWKVENYELFLKRRKELIVDAINDFMSRLKEKNTEEEENPVDLIKGEENNIVEFKSSMRWSYNQNAVDKNLEAVVAKTISAFLNTNGGHLFIGVDDDNNILGLEKDYATLGKRQNQDGFLQKLTDLIDNFLGKSVHALIAIKFIELDNKDVCWIKAENSPYPIYLNDGNEKKFYIRTQNSSKEMYGDEADKYKRQRF